MMISLQEAITRSKNLKRTAEEISSKEKPSKKKKNIVTWYVLSKGRC